MADVDDQFKRQKGSEILKKIYDKYLREIKEV